MLKSMLNKILYPNHYSSEAYVNYLRAGGAKIGENTFFYNPKAKPVDESSLPFIEIGSNCRITSGVVILAHDYSYAVLRPLYHHMLYKTGVTKIGNNVFVGMNAIITMDTKIGDNVIIGAGSVVTKDIPSNVVAAGNPARVICTMEEYYAKTRDRFETYAKTYYERMSAFRGRALRQDEMAWFISLWKGSDKRELYECMKVDGDSREAVVEDMLKVPAEYESFEAFLKACGLKRAGEHGVGQ